jgi:hypothetical protein
MMSQKQQFMAMIKRGQKLTGQNAIAAAGLGLGQLSRSENGDFYLSTVSLEIKTPPGRKSAETFPAPLRATNPKG